jgi:Sel1 repeat
MKKTIKKILSLVLTMILIYGGILLTKFIQGNKFYEEVSEIHNVQHLTKFLDTNDFDKAIFVLSQMSDVDMKRSVKIFEDLWFGGDLFRSLKHKDVYQNPIVRVMLAKELLFIEPKKEYADFIKANAVHSGWEIQYSAAKALIAIKDKQAVQLLVRLAQSKNKLVSNSAIDSLFYIDDRNKWNIGALYEIDKLYNETKDVRLKEKIKEGYVQLEEIRKNNPIVIYDPPFTEKIEPYIQANDYQSAIDIILPYAQQNDVKAQHLVGTYYFFTKPPNYKEALIWLTLAAEADYAPAKVSLSNMYIGGLGVEKNTDKAVQLLKEAEAQGNDSAIELLKTAKTNHWWGL